MLFALDDADLLEFGFIGFACTTALFDEAASAKYLEPAGTHRARRRCAARARYGAVGPLVV